MLRAVALLAMLLVHLGAFGELDGPLHAIVNASFAAICGVSMVLGTRSLVRTRGWKGIWLWGALRGALIVVLGLVLGLLPGEAGGELASFGVAILIASVFVALPTWAVAVTSVLLGAVATEIGARLALPEMRVLASDPDLSFAGGVLTVLRDVFVLGDAPALVITVQVLVGIMIARTLMAARATRTVTRAALAGICVGVIALAAVFLLNIDELVVDRFLSWALLGGAAVSLIVVSLSALLWDRSTTSAGHPIARWLQATGSAPLTVYVIHAMVSALPLDPFVSAVTQVGLTIAVAVIMVLWHLRGPVETAVGEIVKFAVKTCVPFDFDLASGTKKQPLVAVPPPV